RSNGRWRRSTRTDFPRLLGIKGNWFIRGGLNGAANFLHYYFVTIFNGLSAPPPSMNAFGILFLAALALATSTRLGLAARPVNHVRAHSGRVPAEFAAEISLDAHER